MQCAMRGVAIIAIALATGSCLEHGERDPTRYPWDQPKPKATYCVVALEQPAISADATIAAVKKALGA